MNRDRFLPFLAGLALGSAVAFAADAQPAAPVPPADKPLYQFTEAEVGPYLGHLQATEPDLRKRIVALARKNIGQPYELYLLGEMPFETYDPQPLYSIARSDCLVFAEHTYAMALTRDWTGFMRLLQRIRYRDGPHRRGHAATISPRPTGTRRTAGWCATSPAIFPAARP